MGMTIAEKILCERSGKRTIKTGDYLMAKVDFCMANDLTGPIAVEEFRRAGIEQMLDPSKVALVLDHFSPSRDPNTADACTVLRDFAREQSIENFFDYGQAGVSHCLLPEKGLITAGDLVIGADAHSCTYGALGAFGIGVGSTDIVGAMMTGRCWFQVPDTIKVVFRGELQPWVSAKDMGLYLLRQLGFDGAHYMALEYYGEAVSALGQEERFTLCNMAETISAKVAIVPPDEVTRVYLKGRSVRKPKFVHSDKSAKYAATVEYDATLIRPQVALPHSNGHVLSIDELGKEPLDQVYIGTCTNGWLKDLRTAAEVLLIARRQVHARTRLIVVPATPEVYRQALHEGVLQTFADAGAIISPPTCGACFGGHIGVLGKGERCLSTGSRNSAGRMGSPEAEIFLANPAVAAASAVLGRIASPEEI